jgi:hypothetical protein
MLEVGGATGCFWDHLPPKWFSEIRKPLLQEIWVRCSVRFGKPSEEEQTRGLSKHFLIFGCAFTETRSLSVAPPQPMGAYGCLWVPMGAYGCGMRLGSGMN